MFTQNEEENVIFIDFGMVIRVNWAALSISKMANKQFSHRTVYKVYTE